MDVSIVTPSFNSLAFLRRCCASVRDQAGVACEHLVMDGASSDGTPAWLRAAGIRHVSEPDRGMYDAVNKGFAQATGEFVGYLNADEQLLPGALAAACAALRAHPAADLVYGDCLLVRPDGSLVAFRKAYPLRWPYVAAGHLYALSCTMLFRRRLVSDGFLFDTRFRMVGDADFVTRILRAGRRAVGIRRYQAAFTVTGSNLSQDARAQEEWRTQLAAAPAWVRALRLPLHALRLAEKTLHGAYRQHAPLAYELYGDDLAARRRFEATRLSPFWSWNPDAP